MACRMPRGFHRSWQSKKRQCCDLSHMDTGPLCWYDEETQHISKDVATGKSKQGLTLEAWAGVAPPCK
jgi:hypothetical protein